MTLGTLLVKIGADASAYKAAVAESAAGALKLGSTMRGAMQNVAQDAGKAAQAIEGIASHARKLSGEVAHLGLAMGASIGAAFAVVSSGQFDRGVMQTTDRTKKLFQTFATEVAKAFKPMADAANESLGKLISYIQSMDPVLKQHIVSWVTTAVEVSAALLVFSKVATVLKGLAAVANLAMSAVSLIFAPGVLITLGAAALAVMGIVLAVGALKQAIEEIDWGPLAGAGEKAAAIWSSIKSHATGQNMLDSQRLATGADFHPMLRDINGNVVTDAAHAGSAAIAGGGGGGGIPGITDALKKSWDEGAKVLIDPLKAQFTGLVDGFRKVFEDVNGKGKPKIVKTKQVDVEEVGGGAGGVAKGFAELMSRTGVQLGTAGGDPNVLGAHIAALSPLMTSYNKVVEEQTKKRAEVEEELIKKIDEAAKTASKELASRAEGLAGKAGELVKTFGQGTLAAGGNPLGGLAAMAADLLSQSGQFQALMKTVDDVIQGLANAFGAMLAPLIPLVTVIGALAATFLKSTFVTQLLFNVMKGAALYVMTVVLDIETVWNTILDFIASILKKFQLNDQAKAVESMKMDADGTAKALKSLWNSTYEGAVAVGAMATAANAATEALTNVPTGFKVALARFNSTDVGQGSSGGAGVSGAGGSPPPAAGGGNGGGVSVSVTLDGQVVASRIQTKLDRMHGRNFGSTDPNLAQRYMGT